MSHPLIALEKFGQSPWFDNISRKMLDSGELTRLIEEDGLKGITSNPSIFDKAISGGEDYDPALAEALEAGVRGSEELFEALAIKDIREACDALTGIYENSKGVDGYVSLEVSPRLARETQATIDAGKRLFKEVARKNLMIKVPATKEGLPAITELIGAGVNVNVTLIFSLTRYSEVMEAYLNGLEKAENPGAIASVASFFVSRIDNAVDKQLPEDSPLRGKIAIANARLAYKAFGEVFQGKRWETLKAKGARVQRPLWASTSTKDPKYPDTLYIDSMIGPDTVNTIPPATWAAFKHHGTAARTVDQDVAGCEQQMKDLALAGVNLDQITQELEEAGVEAFAKSFQSMLDNLAAKAEVLLKKKPAASSLDAEDVIVHLWAKNAALWKAEAAHKAIIHNSLGWLRMPAVMPDRVAEIETFVGEVKKAGFEHAVVLGMGGSSLAPEVIRTSFGHAAGFPMLHVLDSTDPEAVSALEEAAPPENTLYLIASKSGGTVEPNRMLDYFYAQVKESKGDRAGENFVAITDPGSPLVDKANALKFHRVFLNFADIGGRYSALSYFGIVPAALGGAPIQEILSTAKKMAEACAPGSNENPGATLGLSLAQYAAQGRDKLTLLMPEEIETFGLWLEQLVAESTGKEGKGVVPIALEPARDNYSNDRVFVRYRLEGTVDPFENLSTELEKAGHPVITIHIATKADLGGEFFRWQIATAVLGQRMAINPFDQPNVQSAKEKTKALMASLKKHGELPPVETQCSEGGLTLSFTSAAKPQAKGVHTSITEFLASLKAGEYLGFLPYLNPNGSYESEVLRCREALSATGLAVQAGYGPRYLHSTGQQHKGGSDQGLFILVSRSDGPELDIPGAEHSFAQLVRAQALGDFEALAEAGRRAVLVQVSGDVSKALETLAQAFTAGAKAVKV
jgi:transaldolase/glucose-6-phosphate isomerase